MFSGNDKKIRTHENVTCRSRKTGKISYFTKNWITQKEVSAFSTFIVNKDLNNMFKSVKKADITSTAHYIRRIIIRLFLRRKLLQQFPW